MKQFVYVYLGQHQIVRYSNMHPYGI